MIDRPANEMQTIMNVLSIFDTTIMEYNLGNQIIMQSVYAYLEKIFPDAFFIKIPYLGPLSRESLKYLDISDYIFFGGTNVLSSDMRAYKQWGIDHRSAKKVKNVILMGVGWWQYQQGITPYTKGILHDVLHHDLLHAVRDSYTATKLHEAGFHNVILTSCPTMWGLSPQHCQAIPRDKADSVLFTLTDYNTDRQLDAALIRLLRRKYSKVYCWIQGLGDKQYVTELDPDIQFIPPNLQAFDRFLDTNPDLDYIGTRLHAGIRALQRKKRTIILGIDNRAIEKGKDFNLPVIPRNELNELESRIDQLFATEIELPTANIQRWLGQFQDLPKVARPKTERVTSLTALKRVIRALRR